MERAADRRSEFAKPFGMLAPTRRSPCTGRELVAEVRHLRVRNDKFCPPAEVSLRAAVYMQCCWHAGFQKFVMHPSNPFDRVEIVPARSVDKQAVVRGGREDHSAVLSRPDDRCSLVFSQLPPAFQRPVA